ncbi:hypothetical protein CPter91_4010 [Collimonas pratensis]|uniref:Uncharacterized protein n=1 Tax=Collimonas pratensis TaxID=279113 RepID=A0A127Q8C0_9BURK|nr:hypothetical protein CPter91_4010 [Collimonas pratensis]
MISFIKADIGRLLTARGNIEQWGQRKPIFLIECSLFSLERRAITVVGFSLIKDECPLLRDSFASLTLLSSAEAIL